MKALRLADSLPAGAVIDPNVPQPRPGAGEVRIQVLAAGLTRTEVLWYTSTHTRAGARRSDVVPGHEFSGVVDSMGAHAAGLETGQAVYGMNDWFSDGATAEYCITRPEYIAPKPQNLTHAEAASVPIGALTAWQGLFDRAKLQVEERVLIHGGAGAVGVFAVQLARLRGARVIATAAANNIGFLRELGAEQVIDYRADRFEDVAGMVDVVFDTVGGEILQRSWNVIKPGGRMITIASGSEASVDARVKEAFFIVEPKQEQLKAIGVLLENGQIRPVVDAVVPFAEAPAAYFGNIKTRRGCGKAVVAIAAT